MSADPTMSGPWQLEKGNHTLMWKWVKANSTTPATRDTALIYDIKVCEPPPRAALCLTSTCACIPAHLYASSHTLSEPCH